MTTNRLQIHWQPDNKKFISKDQPGPLLDLTDTTCQSHQPPGKAYALQRLML